MKTILFVLFLLFASVNSFAQYQNLIIYGSYSPNETSIMINPKNTNIVVAGANALYSNSWSSYHYSTNGGLTWGNGFLISSVAFPSGDPVIIVDTLGHFYYIQNSNGSGSGGYDRHLVCKSTNSGMNWSQGVTYGKNGTKLQDKPWGCVDLTHGPYGNYVYSTWTEFDVYMSSNPLDSTRILFTRSTDGGFSFSAPKRISRFGGKATDGSETVEGAVPCIGTGGQIYVSWAGPRGICFNKSSDGGITWMGTETDVVPPYLNGWAYNIPGFFRCNGLPITCCDLSNGPYRGTIYINWSDQRNGTTDTDVWLIKSTNGGQTWSSIKRVNNDPPGKHNFLCWMCVDQATGHLYFVFYDRRNTTGNANEVYIARSTNSGETFTNHKISESPFITTGYEFMGDYNGISAHNGRVRPIWTRSSGGSTLIYTAIIDSIIIGINKTGEQVPGEYSLLQNYPNPFNGSTVIKFDIPVNSEVRADIYSLTGSHIETLVNDYLTAGVYKINWSNNNLSSGIYFYTITAGKFKDAKKMILIK